MAPERQRRALLSCGNALPRLVRVATRGMFCVALAAAVTPCAIAVDHKPATPQLPTINPAATIAVAPTGYQPPSDAYLTSRPSFASLDFLDENHLLFTFHK